MEPQDSRKVIDPNLPSCNDWFQVCRRLNHLLRLIIWCKRLICWIINHLVRRDSNRVYVLQNLLRLNIIPNSCKRILLIITSSLSLLPKLSSLKDRYCHLI